MEQCNWFESWFDTKYYHLLYKNRDLYEAKYFIRNIVGELNLSPSARVWDNACGNGRHIAVFAEMGFECIGTDLSQNNISLANDAFGDKASFFKHDMRRIFYLNYFDLAVNLFTSIGYFDSVYENVSVIKNMAVAVKRNAYVIIDFLNPDYLIANLIPFEKKEIEGLVFEINKSIENGFVLKKIKITNRSNEIGFFQERVRLLSFHFFKYTFDNTGLILKKVYGDYALNPFNKQSPRMIFICQKK